MATFRAILCLDIDGTLIDDQEKIRPQDREVLQDLPAWLQVVIHHRSYSAFRQRGSTSQWRLSAAPLSPAGGIHEWWVRFPSK